LQQALDAILRRHEALRTTFASVDGEPVQIISEQQAVQLLYTDLRPVPAADRETAYQRQLMEEARRPFNLSADLMLRPTLVQLQDEDSILLLIMHHIASDGWSVSLLMQELGAFYTAFVTGAAVALPVLPIQYADYAVWQRQW
jgi:Condensation domain